MFDPTPLHKRIHPHQGNNFGHHLDAALWILHLAFVRRCSLSKPFPKTVFIFFTGSDRVCPGTLLCRSIESPPLQRCVKRCQQHAIVTHYRVAFIISILCLEFLVRVHCAPHWRCFTSHMLASSPVARRPRLVRQRFSWRWPTLAWMWLCLSAALEAVFWQRDSRDQNPSFPSWANLCCCGFLTTSLWRMMTRSSSSSILHSWALGILCARWSVLSTRTRSLWNWMVPLVARLKRCSLGWRVWTLRRDARHCYSMETPSTRQTSCPSFAMLQPRTTQFSVSKTHNQILSTLTWKLMPTTESQRSRRRSRSADFANSGCYCFKDGTQLAAVCEEILRQAGEGEFVHVTCDCIDVGKGRAFQGDWNWRGERACFGNSCTSTGILSDLADTATK